jgi:hypothetical protein
MTRESIARETRILRDRLAALQRALDRDSAGNPAFSSARMLVQVYDGGSMPSAPEMVYFTHPVLASGAESEGESATLTVDTVTTVPVIVLGHAPSVGDYLTAYAVGGRWVSEKGKTGGGLITTCSPCDIPNEDLTITWTNALTGGGVATLHYDTSTGWTTTSCVDGGLLFHLGCGVGGIELRAIYFIDGSCPSGTQQYCSNLQVAPLTLTPSAYTCSPFSLTFTIDELGCPALFGDGNTQFVVTQ